MRRTNTHLDRGCLKRRGCLLLALVAVVFPASSSRNRLRLAEVAGRGPRSRRGLLRRLCGLRLLLPLPFRFLKVRFLSLPTPLLLRLHLPRRKLLFELLALFPHLTVIILSIFFLHVKMPVTR